jgi:hypothetical protein
MQLIPTRKPSDALKRAAAARDGQLEDAKVTRARELMREKEDNARRVAEEKALEMVRKQELIRQLKAIEAVPVSRVDKYDPTTTQGQGLLEEVCSAHNCGDGERRWEF